MSDTLQKETEETINSGTPQNGVGSDSEQTTNTLEDVESKLDAMLNGHGDLEAKLAKMESIISKQNEVIDKQSKEIEDLKLVNLDLAQHGDNNAPKTVEELLYEGFKDWR